MRCRCGNWAWWSKSNLWTSSRRNLQNIRSGWGLYAFHRYPHVGMNFIGCQQFRNINSDWNTEAGNTCREEFQGNAMKQLWIYVYILKKLQWWSMVLVWSLNTLEYAGSTSKDFRHFWGHIHTTSFDSYWPSKQFPVPGWMANGTCRSSELPHLSW